MYCPMGCVETVTVNPGGKAKAKVIATGGRAELKRIVKPGNLTGIQNIGMGGGSQAQKWEVWRCPQCGFMAGFYDRPSGG